MKQKKVEEIFSTVACELRLLVLHDNEADYVFPKVINEKA